MDGLNLELEDDTFDVSASQLGVTVIPDFKRGLAEMVRVTKPGGKVLIAALGPPQKAEFLGVFLAALKATVPSFTGPPTDPPPTQFQVADPATFRERLAEAELKDITVESVTFGLEFRSPANLWGFLMSSNPIGRILVANLTEDQRTEVREVLAGMLRERSGGNGKAVLNLDINIGLGTK
jgi:SAM-dependent methyltransferase